MIKKRLHSINYLLIRYYLEYFFHGHDDYHSGVTGIFHLPIKPFCLLLIEMAYFILFRKTVVILSDNLNAVSQVYERNPQKAASILVANGSDASTI